MQHRSMLVTCLRRGFRNTARWVACAVIALAAAPLVAADWKPTAQIEIVIPNSPGGGNDAVGRLLQKLLQDRRLIPTAPIVSNKPAGGGSATLSYLGQKANDPHIIAVVSITQQLNYITGTQAQRYRDFTPLATMIGVWDEPQAHFRAPSVEAADDPRQHELRGSRNARDGQLTRAHARRFGHEFQRGVQFAQDPLSAGQQQFARSG